MAAETPVHNRKSNWYFLISFALINLLTFTLLICTLGFLAGITVAGWQFPLAIICTLVVNFFVARHQNREKSTSFFIKSGLFFIVFVVFSVLIAGYFYDISYDGQWYHQQTIIQLKEGYNPVRHTVRVPANELPVPGNDWCAGNPTGPIDQTTSQVNLKYLSLNHFPKANEIMGAAIYLFTGHIETGKAVNIIILFASFFLCLSLLYQVDRLKPTVKWLLAALLAFNPIAINQLISFLVDGFASGYLLCLLITFCLLLKKVNWYYLFLLASLILVTVNIKLTIMVFGGIFCFGFLAVLWFIKQREAFRKVLITGVAAAVIGIVCCGFNPYVTNTVNKHNIFYGIAETRGEIQRLTPPLLANQNRFGKLFISLAAHQDEKVGEHRTLMQTLKIPFTFTKRDVYEGTDSETGLSGFGPFFSGAMLIALIILAMGFVYARSAFAFRLALAAFGVVLLTILIMPDTWWFRYIPQLWLLPLIILAMALFITIPGKRILNAIIYTSMALNVVWSMLIIGFIFYNTVQIDYQLQQVKALNQPIELHFCSSRSFNSNLVRFREAGVEVSNTDIPGTNLYNITYSTTRIESLAPLPDIPKPAFLKLSSIILGKTDK